MFSVAATIAVTLIFGFSCAIACIAAITEAPPVMSPFMFPIPEAGFNDIPRNRT